MRRATSTFNRRLSTAGRSMRPWLPTRRSKPAANLNSSWDPSRRPGRPDGTRSPCSNGSPRHTARHTCVRKSASCRLIAAASLFLSISAADAAASPTFDVKPERDLLARLLHAHASQFELGAIAADDGYERFRISNANGHIKVDGSTPSALLFGVNWYLKYIARVHVSPNGVRLGPARTWPLPAAVIEKDAPYAYRYALNQNTDGYTTAYWSWPRWEHEIDVLALSGINAMIVERGMDTVL